VRLAGAAAALVSVLALAGCGSDGTSSSLPSTGDDVPAGTPSVAAVPVDPPSPTATATASRPNPGATLITSDSEFGPMLYDDSGQPIYLFTAESGPSPACYDECAADWPPVLTSGAPQATAGVRPRLLGSTRRSDGGTQVTYAGHPLYYYAHEGKYQVLCHDVDEYGGTWLVVRPNGTPPPG